MPIVEEGVQPALLQPAIHAVRPGFLPSSGKLEERIGGLRLFLARAARAGAFVGIGRLAGGRGLVGLKLGRFPATALLPFGGGLG